MTFTHIGFNWSSLLLIKKRPTIKTNMRLLGQKKSVFELIASFNLILYPSSSITVCPQILRTILHEN